MKYPKYEYVAQEGLQVRMALRMKIEDINQSKIPFVKIDKSLEKFRGKVLFQEKLDLANQLLGNASLPTVPKLPTHS